MSDPMKTNERPCVQTYNVFGYPLVQAVVGACASNPSLHDQFEPSCAATPAGCAHHNYLAPEEPCGKCGQETRRTGAYMEERYCDRCDCVTWPETPTPEGGVKLMDDYAFSGLLTLFMCADPTPLVPMMDAAVETLLNEESRKRGYETWTVAYHEFKPEGEPCSDAPAPEVATTEGEIEISPAKVAEEIAHRISDAQGGSSAEDRNALALTVLSRYRITERTR